MRTIFVFIFMVLYFSVSAQRIEKYEDQASILWKEFEIRNNKWGSYKIKKGHYIQSIFLEDYVPGWKWKTPGKSYGVLGYPMIFLGTSAWNNLEDVKTNNYFKNLNEINEFTVNYQTKLVVNDKKYNLAFDFWLHNSPKVAFETITTEVMIWEDYNKFKPFGKKKAKLTTKSGQYEVYIGDIYKKELKKGWKYVAFIRINKRQSGKIDLKEFITYLKENYFLDNNNYMSSFEFGTEILNSEGELSIKNYHVTIN